MDLLLEDEAELLARQLAALTGESVEDAVLQALREKLVEIYARKAAPDDNLAE